MDDTSGMENDIETDLEGGDEQRAWNSLPAHLMVKVLSSLDIEDKFRATAACTHWRECFKLPDVWENVCFRFLLHYKTEGYMSVLNMFGHYFVNLSIVFSTNRALHVENATKVLDHLNSLTGNSIKQLHLEVMGSIFAVDTHTTMRFMLVFYDFFDNRYNESAVNIRRVKLKRLLCDLNEDIVDQIAKNTCESLTSFSNWDPECSVSANSILSFCKRCVNLTHLSICYCCVTDELLLTLAGSTRAAILRLKITCRADQPITACVSASAWKSLRKRSPYFRVSIKVEQPLSAVLLFDILTPEIPVNKLRLMTNYKLSKDIDTLVEFYCTTLEEVIIVPSAFTDNGLGDAVRKLARSCPKLRILKVLGKQVSRNTLEKIQADFPKLILS